MAEAVAAGWHVESQFVPEGTDAWIGDIGDTFELAARRVRTGRVDADAPAADRHRADARGRRRRGARVGGVRGRARRHQRSGQSRHDRSFGGGGRRRSRRAHPGLGRPVQPEGRPCRRPARSSTCRWSSPNSTTSPSAGVLLIGTSSHDAPGRNVVAHTDCDLTGRIALVMGNEAAGFPPSGPTATARSTAGSRFRTAVAASPSTSPWRPPSSSSKRRGSVAAEPHDRLSEGQPSENGG